MKSSIQSNRRDWPLKEGVNLKSHRQLIRGLPLKSHRQLVRGLSAKSHRPFIGTLPGINSESSCLRSFVACGLLSVLALLSVFACGPGGNSESESNPSSSVRNAPSPEGKDSSLPDGNKDTGKHSPELETEARGGPPNRHSDQDSDSSHDQQGHDDHDNHGSHNSYGTDMAVLEADEHTGIVLADRAIETCEIRFSDPGQYGPESIPGEARVYVGYATLVYVQKQSRIFPVLLEGNPGAKIQALKRPGELDFSNLRLVVKNADLVHLALLEAFGASGSGHGH